MAKLIRKLIFKNLAAVYEFIDFNLANYFANYSQNIFITPKHLKLAACGSLLGGFFNNLLEGYRTPLQVKITQHTHFKTPIQQGGARKALL